MNTASAAARFSLGTPQNFVETQPSGTT